MSQRYKITWYGGKVCEGDHENFEAACKFANAYGGLVKKVERVDPAEYQKPVEMDCTHSPGQVEQELEDDRRKDRMIRTGKTPNVRKRG
jgi:hypothetical protein